MERMSAQIQAGSLCYTTARLLDATLGGAKCGISILLVFFSRQVLRLILAPFLPVHYFLGAGGFCTPNS
jgi:hypothetical protein